MKTILNKRKKILSIFLKSFIVSFMVFPIYAGDLEPKIHYPYKLVNSMTSSNQLGEYAQQNVENNVEFTNQEKKDESNVSSPARESQEQKEKPQNTATPQTSKKTVDECVNMLVSGEKENELLAVGTCAKEYQENEKIQDALLKLIENSNDDKIITLSLLLLSNKKKDNISETLINLINNNKFQGNRVQTYNALLVLYSSLSDKYKAQAKEIFNNYSYSDDELLKHLSENLAKKN